MPELPEVEVICRGLSSLILGDNIKKTLIKCGKLRNNINQDLPSIIRSRDIESITRKAKYLLINLSGNISLIIHLGMTGNLSVRNQIRSPYNKHEHVIFFLKNNRELVYKDVRRFGLITSCQTNKVDQHSLFANNGCEPLDQAFNGEYLANKLRDKNINIKQALMDNKILVGVGNIYSCEILFRSNISPLRKSREISIQEIVNLVKNTKLTLQEAIIAGGSSFKDYLDAEGKKGYFQNNFQVYQRQNNPCNNCLYPISKIKQNGRSSFFCVNCQI